MKISIDVIEDKDYYLTTSYANLFSFGTESIVKLFITVPLGEYCYDIMISSFSTGDVKISGYVKDLENITKEERDYIHLLNSVEIPVEVYELISKVIKEGILNKVGTIVETLQLETEEDFIKWLEEK